MATSLPYEEENLAPLFTASFLLLSSCILSCSLILSYAGVSTKKAFSSELKAPAILTAALMTLLFAGEG